MESEYSLLYSGANTLTKGIQMTVSGSDILLNFLVITGTLSRHCKTSIKFVISLAFADMAVAAFHLIMQLVSFINPWTNDANIIMTMVNDDFNVTMPGILGISVISLRAPLNIFGNVGVTEDDGSKPIESLSKILRLPDDIVYMSTFPVNSNISFIGVDYLGTTKPETMLQKWLAASYLMPNIACLLILLCITTGLNITVTKPLKAHFLLSKKRGNVITISIWLFAFTISIGVFVYVIIQEPGGRDVEQRPLVHEITRIIWFVTLFVFCVITFMYILVIYILTCKRTPKTSSSGMEGSINVRATVTTIAITGTYAVCYLPFVWYRVLQELNLFFIIEQNFAWIEVMQIVFLFNTNLDAVIYAFRLPEVSGGIKKNKIFNVQVKCLFKITITVKYSS